MRSRYYFGKLHIFERKLCIYIGKLCLCLRKLYTFQRKTSKRLTGSFLSLRRWPAQLVIHNEWAHTVVALSLLGCGDVVCVIGGAITLDLGIDGRTSSSGPLELFEDEDSAALPHDKSIQVLVERPRGELRLIISS